MCLGFLGINHISREAFIEAHTRATEKALFADGKEGCILVADGTYIYTEKSSNYRFQRRTFPMDKVQPLLKPMILVSSDGYILDVLDPYSADGENDDANILTSIMQSNISSFRTWLYSDDVFVVSRGFRDSLSLLESLRFVPKMPRYVELST